MTIPQFPARAPNAGAIHPPKGMSNLHHNNLKTKTSSGAEEVASLASNAMCTCEARTNDKVVVGVYVLFPSSVISLLLDVMTARRFRDDGW